MTQWLRKCGISKSVKRKPLESEPMADERNAVEIDPSDLASLRRALSQIESQAPGELTKGAQKASRTLATAARQKLAGSSVYGRLVAPSVRSVSGSNPGVTAGGSGMFRAPRSPGDDPSYGALLFGAEYGVKGTQWSGHKWRGKGASSGYGIWPSVRNTPAFYTDWTDDLITFVDRVWSHG